MGSQRERSVSFNILADRAASPGGPDRRRGCSALRAERLLEFCETLGESEDLSALAEFRG